MKALAIELLTGLLIVGCAQANDEDYRTIRLGMSREQMALHFKGPGAHQFSVLRDSNAFECVSYAFKRPFIRYYFLFKNDQLHSILDPQSFIQWRINVLPDGRQVEVQAPWSTEDRLRRVIESPSLSEREFGSEIERRIAEEESRNPDFNVLPAFVFLAPLIVPEAIQRRTKEQEWQKRYDPRKIMLGMLKSDVTSEFGEPMFILSDRNAETRAYGPAELLFRDTGRLYLGPINKKNWIAVVFQAGKVTRILSNDMFNDENIVHKDNEVRK